MTTDQPARFTADDYADAAELLQMLIPNYGTFQPSAFPKLTNVILDALARQAAEPGEPVAWRVKDFGDGWIATNNKTVVRNCIAEGHIVEPLYAHPPAPAPSAPGGWQEAIEAADKATIVIETHLGTETWIRTGISKPALATPPPPATGEGE